MECLFCKLVGGKCCAGDVYHALWKLLLLASAGLSSGLFASSWFTTVMLSTSLGLTRRVGPGTEACPL